MIARLAPPFSDGPAVDVVAAVAALALHAGVVLAPPHARPSTPPLRLAEVELFDLQTPPPRIDPPEPLPAAAPTSPRVARSPTPDRRAPATSTPEAAENAAPAPDDGPLDLSASVLAGNDGIAFGGTGGGGGGSARLEAAAPPPAAAPAERVARGAADLSVDVRPPPGLDRMLEDYFPSDARAQGLHGSARVRLRVDALGRVTNATVTSETPPGAGFGSACRRMLLAAPPWSPALDPAGAPIARAGRDFLCRFELR